MTAQTTEEPQEATRETVIDLLGSVIAKSRYEAWDGHRNDMTWEEFRVANPVVASNIYLEDGRRDALALMPYITGSINQAAVRMLTKAAAELKTSEQPTAAALVERMADDLDWRKKVQR